MTKIIDEKFKMFIEKLFIKPINDVTQDDYNSIIYLNLSNLKIKNLQGIENFINLEYLDCSFNSLKTFNISQNTKLKYVFCVNCRLTNLDVSNNIQLYYLKCHINFLKTLNLLNNKKLNYLNCSENRLKKLDLSSNKKLDFCYYDENMEVTI